MKVLKYTSVKYIASFFNIILLIAMKSDTNRDTIKTCFKVSHK